MGINGINERKSSGIRLCAWVVQITMGKTEPSAKTIKYELAK